jgi:heat shock protein HtpX
MVMALLFGGAMNFFAYWFSDKMVLKMYNAQEVDETSAPQFYAMVASSPSVPGCRCRASI